MQLAAVRVAEVIGRFLWMQVSLLLMRRRAFISITINLILPQIFNTFDIS